MLWRLARDANACFGSGGTALVIDESGFAKKGSIPPARLAQWDGRLGKSDNSQVGVFAAVPQGEVATLVDAGCISIG